MATADTPSQSRLKESIRTDVCIIGAGIAGLTTAYLLGMEGRSVVVLDDGPSGGGMTGRTTAHLTNAYDDRYVEIEKMHGEKGSRLTAQSHTAAIEKINQ
ncbi:MAG TPA: FAD-binding oxidoreductase, partial [Pyrinomonadaceae bacterium]